MAKRFSKSMETRDELSITCKLDRSFPEKKIILFMHLISLTDTSCGRKMNKKLPGSSVELISLETTSMKKGGNKVSETLRSKLSVGL